MAFRGNFDHSLDAKNRLTVPSKFRAVLSDGIVLARGAEPCVQVWPQADYERQTTIALERLNPLSPEARELKRRLFANTFDTELDSAGRVMIPPKLVDHASLRKDVAVIGAGEHLEVWDRGTWDSLDAESPTRIHELTSSLADTA